MTPRFSLSKDGEASHSDPPHYRAGGFVINLSWDSNHDLDAFALLGQNRDGKARVFEAGHILSCHNVGPQSNLILHEGGVFSTPCGTVIHSGDARDGIEDEIDETITIRCEQAPRGVNEILVFVVVHRKGGEKQTFKGIKKSRVTVLKENGDELGSYRLSRFSDHTCVHVASIMLRDDGWECVLIGDGFTGDLNSILARLQPDGPTAVAASHASVISADILGAGEGSRELSLATGILVSLDDLRRTNPSASEEVLMKACGLIRSCDPAGMTMIACLEWGKSVQQMHSRIVGRWSKLSNAQDLGNLRTRLAELQEVLQSIDMSRLRGSDRGQGGLFGFFKRPSGSGRRDIAKELSAKKDQIDRLVGAVKDRKEYLLRVRDRILKLGEDIRELQSEALAFVIAGMHIEKHLRQKGLDAHCADALDQRCDALTRTQAELSSSSGVSELAVQQILQLLSIAEETVLLSIPTWTTNLLAIQLLYEKDEQPAESDLRIVEEGLGQISSVLK